MLSIKRLLTAIALSAALLCGPIEAAQQTINVGTTANDGTGDTVRSAFTKANSNFAEVYSTYKPVTPYVAGQYYFMVPYVTLGAGAAPGLTNGYCVPWSPKQTATLSELDAWVTTTDTGKTFALALYSNNPATNRPTGTALAITASTLSTSTAGAVAGALVTNYQVVKPLSYWVCSQTNSSVVIFAGPPAGYTQFGSEVGSATLSDVWSAASSTAQAITFVIGTYGTFSDLSSASFAFNQSARAPAYLVKFASVP